MTTIPREILLQVVTTLEFYRGRETVGVLKKLGVTRATAALSALRPYLDAPEVDVEGLKIEKMEASIRNTDRENGFVEGWNDCIDHLAATGRLRVAPELTPGDVLGAMTGGKDALTSLRLLKQGMDTYGYPEQKHIDRHFETIEAALTHPAPKDTLEEMLESVPGKHTVSFRKNTSGVNPFWACAIYDAYSTEEYYAPAVKIIHASEKTPAEALQAALKKVGE